MNISQSRLQGIIKTYLRDPIKTKEEANKKAEGKYGDKVVFSEEVQEFTWAMKLAAQAKDIRLEKVCDLRKKIESGTYNIDGELVAEKILKECTTNKLI